MTDADTIMQGMFIGLFSAITIGAIGFYIRSKKGNVATMKQSPSMEELTNIGVEDPSVNT